MSVPEAEAEPDNGEFWTVGPCGLAWRLRILPRLLKAMERTGTVRFYGIVIGDFTVGWWRPSK